LHFESGLKQGRENHTFWSEIKYGFPDAHSTSHPILPVGPTSLYLSIYFFERERDYQKIICNTDTGGREENPHYSDICIKEVKTICQYKFWFLWD